MKAACRSYPSGVTALVERAVSAIAEGDVAGLGALMREAQRLFDSCLAPVTNALLRTSLLSA